MKKVIVLLLCIATGFSPALLAQQKAAKAKGPVLTFKGGDTHDFGSVKKGPIVHYIFEFTNTGKEPLVIRDINPSCGCTSVEFENAKSGWDKMPVMPGKKGHIRVGLKTDEQHGNFLKDVSILSNATNAGPDQRYPIHIRGLAIENTDKAAAPAKH